MKRPWEYLPAMSKAPEQKESPSTRKERLREATCYQLTEIAARHRVSWPTVALACGYSDTMVKKWARTDRDPNLPVLALRAMLEDPSTHAVALDLLTIIASEAGFLLCRLPDADGDEVADVVRLTTSVRESSEAHSAYAQAMAEGWTPALARQVEEECTEAIAAHAEKREVAKRKLAEYAEEVAAMTHRSGR